MKLAIAPRQERKSANLQLPLNSSRILFFDLESVGVNAFFGDTGIMLMCAYKWADGDTQILTMTRDEFQTLDDLRIVTEISTRLEEADIRCGHYGQYFDIKFVNTRRLMLGLPPLSERALEVDDPLKTLWKTTKFHSNRLGHIARALQLKQKKGESNFPGPWMQIIRFRDDAAWGSYQKMAVYCQQDVRTLEEEYFRLHPEKRPK